MLFYVVGQAEKKDSFNSDNTSILKNRIIELGLCNLAPAFLYSYLILRKISSETLSS